MAKSHITTGMTMYLALYGAYSMKHMISYVRKVGPCGGVSAVMERRKVVERLSENKSKLVYNVTALCHSSVRLNLGE